VKIRKTPLFRFVVLIPHRDCRPFLRDYSRRLFAAGLPGAYSFPPVVPLALVSRPCTPGELVLLAHSLREITMTGGRDGRIRTGRPLARASIFFPGKKAPPGAGDAGAPELWGLSLELGEASGEESSPPGLTLPPGALPGDLVRGEFPLPVLGAALIGPAAPDRELAAAVPPPPPFFFRAAAVANMVFSPLGGEPGCSWEWKTGNPRWLPSPRG
jgi:hypothetical protein